MRKIILALGMVVMMLSTVTTFAFQGKVMGVLNGDTIKVLNAGKQVRVRLYGIDCPKKAQDYGKKAKALVRSMAVGKIVDVEVIDRDRYGRSVGIVTLGEDTLNEILIRDGLAWVYPQYCKIPICNVWSQLEKRARERKVGLWRDPNPTPPWEYRRIKRSR